MRARRPPRFAAFLLASIVVWSTTGCERARPDVRTPIVRFVDAAVSDPVRGARGTGVPRGSLRDRMRYVVPFRHDGFEGTFETPAVAIPAGAELDFALGARVAPVGDRVVTFEIRICDGGACEPLVSERIDFAAVDTADWLERRVALERYAGTSRRFVFRVVTTSPSTKAFVANPAIFARRPHSHDTRNVILISLDTLRASRLGSYGYRHDTAPFIDEAFARGGTLFEHCVAAATTTTASHMTMFTSLPPSVHGVGVNDVTPLPAWLVTVPEVLRAAGFTTGAVTENGWVTVVQGFGRGFDTYVEDKGPNIMEPKGQADVMFRTGEEFLRRHRDERFFLFLHTYQVHAPYVPPAEYASLFGAPSSDVPSAAAADSANYDREIRFTDDMLRKLFATLRELHLDDETAVVLTADHGDEFLEHGCLQHGGQLYEEVTHVPLLLLGPGIPKGVRVSEPVGLVDLMPTILDLAGVRPPEQAMGISLVAAATSGHAPPERRLVTESWSDHFCVGRTIERPGFAVREGTWKLARSKRDGADVYELYDVASDPREQRDRYAERRADHADLRAFLDGYRDDCRARRAELQQRAGGAAVAPAEAVPLDARQREKLRALGYAE